jgi:hypothetical protein
MNEAEETSEQLSEPSEDADFDTTPVEKTSDKKDA